MVKQDGVELISGEEESNTIAVPSSEITYDSNYTGYITVYLPDNAGQTDISVTVPGLNNGAPITVSGQTISKWNQVTEITMYEEDISCRHENFDTDGFCVVCKMDISRQKKAVDIIRFGMRDSCSGLRSRSIEMRFLIIVI